MLRNLVPSIVAILLVISGFAVAHFNPDLFKPDLPTFQDYTAKSGIFGEHQLRYPANSSTLSGSIHGNFFILTGSLSGNIQTDDAISFSWSPGPETIIYSKFPKTLYQIVLDESKHGSPTVELVFNKELLGKYVHEDHPSALDSENPNTLLNYCAGQIDMIKVRISKADLMNEPAFPQL
ncbi:MAG: hypothetical protein UW95_C0031G0005 [Parcubacteria group bacterium GW2011_GWC1_45_14]|nr:MAG: hypothetical protein UW87_C0031G0012 [Candidatus Moranbacteria bacterium GW2011_GWC2_45_10]KKT92620.1 MAG: hypothetical protein UW95_C0031G0005 [Parcubacteria group bacterium GW2011_GWC1_45_14]